jgi:hypothetical protein
LLWWVDADTGRVWASGSGGQFLIIDRPNQLATVVRNNTGASIPGRLWYTMAQVEDEDRASEARAAAVHAEVASCE